MLLKIDPELNIDLIKINFDDSGLWLLNIVLAIIMFGVSLSITISDFKNLLQNPKILFIGIFSQFIALPFVTFIFILLIQPHPSFALGLIMIAACPGGNTSNFYSKMANGNIALSISLTAFATLICIVTTPFNLHFWGSLYSPTNAILKTIELSPYDLFKLVALILGIPLICGMLVNHYFPNLAKKIGRILKPFSIIIFLTLIIGAFSQNLDIFSNHIHHVFFLVIIHNIITFMTGYFIAKFFNLSKKDKITITIETGIQNGGLGLLLIFGFFGDLGGMALLAAFWGVWNILSGLMLSFILNKKHKTINQLA